MAKQIQFKYPFKEGSLQLFPTFNKQMREHWSFRKKRKEFLMWETRSQYTHKPSFHKHTTADLHLYLVRLRDDDGLSACFKALGDALVEADILVDDSPKYLKVNVFQHKVTKHQDQEVELILYETPQQNEN